MKKNKSLIQMTVQLSLVMALLIFGVTPAQANPGATFTVNSALDGQLAHDTTPGDGLCENTHQVCTLRAAIEEANAHLGDDKIVFSSAMNIAVDVAGEGPLPDITQTLTIDAISVWNTSSDQPGIKIAPTGTTSVQANGLTIKSDNGNYFGLHMTDWANGAGIYIEGASNSIGSVGHQRNVISGNFNGIVISGSASKNNQVAGNYIGLTPDGSAANANLNAGILISSSAAKNIVGGVNTDDGNFISGNSYEGILLDMAGNDNEILGNVIGLDVNYVGAGNGTYGIAVFDTDFVYIGTTANQTNYANNFVGHNNLGGISLYSSDDAFIQSNELVQNKGLGVEMIDSQGAFLYENDIMDNTGHGVLVDGSLSVGNTIYRNSITFNSGKGIELLNGANNGISAPVITSASTASVSGSGACVNCDVLVYIGDDDEGGLYIISTTADTSGNWTAYFMPSSITSSIMTVQTHNNISGDSSEFSAPKTVQP
ncbi:MAG: hypothetical protein GY755_07020 [Chloroflexi bacterium]|nr:hypothetical protein [Chloroflexota bacterium]